MRRELARKGFWDLRGFLRLIKALTLLVAVLAVFGLAWWVRVVSFVPIEVVKLEQRLQYVDPRQIKVIVSAEVQRGFFGMRVKRVTERLAKVPWVEEAFVQRSWPNVVQIKLVERQPLAVWENRAVIDTHGRVFKPSNLHNLESVPVFRGKIDKIDAMVDVYLQVLAAIKPYGLGIKRLELMVDDGWRVVLDKGITLILGQAELAERLRRFVLAYSSDSMQWKSDRAYVVDLRYTNGIAIADGGVV